MKKLLSVLSIATVMVACNNNPQTAATESAKLEAFKDSLRLAADTAGLAQFQTWKMQNELADVNQYQTAAVAAAATQPARTYAPAPKRSTSRSTASKSRPSYESGSMSSESSSAAKAPVAKRAKISKAAKGAAVGAVTGAVAGAVINKKNRVVGGVVGGVLGGGVGYGIGRGMDKRDGRY